MGNIFIMKRDSLSNFNETLLTDKYYFTVIFCAALSDVYGVCEGIKRLKNL